MCVRSRKNVWLRTKWSKTKTNGLKVLKCWCKCMSQFSTPLGCIKSVEFLNSSPASGLVCMTQPFPDLSCISFILHLLPLPMLSFYEEKGELLSTFSRLPTDLLWTGTVGCILECIQSMYSLALQLCLWNEQCNSRAKGSFFNFTYLSKFPLAPGGCMLSWFLFSLPISIRSISVRSPSIRYCLI